MLYYQILKIDQETVDMFGKEQPKPPEFLVTIQAMNDPSITILKIPVILNGVDTKESKIFIVRTFEEGTFFFIIIILNCHYIIIIKGIPRKN